MLRNQVDGLSSRRVLAFPAGLCAVIKCALRHEAVLHAHQAYISNAGPRAVAQVSSKAVHNGSHWQ